MINIFVVIGCSVAAILVTLVFSYILPREKVRAANQSLNEEEQKQQLRIKDLEKEYLEKQRQLEQDFHEKSEILQEQNNALATKQLNILNQIQTDKDAWEKEKAQDLLNFTQQTNQLQIEVRGLEERRDNIIQTLETEAKQSGEIFKTQQIQIAQEQIEKAKSELLAEYEKAKEEAKESYLETLADMVSEITAQYGVKSKELEDILVKLSEAQAKADAAVKVNKRAEMERQQKDFYRLQLSEVDLEEIKRLRSVEPYLRDKEPLNKVIYKCYYEKPYTDLVGRVIGAKPKMGIYKITNIENGMCYVGQAVNIADRWKQHIRRGVGADPPTQNKLYPVMRSVGVENFTFEIIEECAGKDLNSREDYWQAFYHAKDFGYSIK